MTGDVGKIYADAFFQLCQEEGNLEEAYNDLNQCGKIFDENPDLLKIMTSPTISVSEKIDILSKLFSDCGVVFNLLCLLTEKNRAGYVSAVAKAFGNMYNEYNNIAEMTVTTCIPLTDELREKMIKSLSAKFKKTVKLNEKIDKDIIGGVIVEYGSIQMDNSIRTKLNSVKKELKV